MRVLVAMLCIGSRPVDDVTEVSRHVCVCAGARGSAGIHIERGEVPSPIYVEHEPYHGGKIE